jgi:hypothetical protein
MKRKSPKHSVLAKIVFLFDVDNTLLDNDRVIAALRSHLEKEVGHKGSQCYRNNFELRREELGCADYPAALHCYRGDPTHATGLPAVSRFLTDYPLVHRLFPYALDNVERVKQWGTAVILFDGDVVFQPRKVERSELFEAVDGNVLTYVHTLQELDDVAERFPADHYVMVDDKLRILAAINKIRGRRVTTVFVRQGHYVLDLRILAACPAADVSIERIGDLLNYGPANFTPRAKVASDSEMS